MSSVEVKVVFDVESGTVPVPLGTFIHQKEDIVIYENLEGLYAQAPEDCVKVVTVEVPR